jgi:hypothetical protein
LRRVVVPPLGVVLRVNSLPRFRPGQRLWFWRTTVGYDPVGSLVSMVSRWPAITEPMLRERQAMSDEEFFEFLSGLLAQVGPRTLEDAHYQQAISYPWGRPAGSCLVTGGEVEALAEMSADRRDALVDEYLHAPQRIRLLGYGANASPERLALKLEHLDDGYRRALILAGDLEDFDVGTAAQGPWFLTMPGTLVPSPGTTVRVGLLLLTPFQFTMLWWTELSYKVGELDSVILTTDVADEPVRRVLVFVSRFGAFCPDDAPVVLSAITARDRRWPALTQSEILDAAARLTLGGGARARDILEAAYANPTAFMDDQFPKLRAVSIPFESEHWTEMPSR